jgi:release factor glutamine methyltransferase
VKVQEAIQNASQLFKESRFTSPRLDAEVLLAHLLKVRKIDLYLDHLRCLNRDEVAGYASLIQRRLRGEPVAYITGEREFWSLTFTVNPHCLIPRPETELLVERALEIYHTSWTIHSRPYRILDLGTGCGAIAICLAREIPNAQITATDFFLDTLAIARENVEKHGVSERVELLPGNLFTPVSERTGWFDIIISNPPYVAGRDFRMLPREVIEYEPHTALFGGEDGLVFYRSIIPESVYYLKEQGWIILEVGSGEKYEVTEILRDSRRFKEISVREDFSGVPRVVSARKNYSE